MTAHDPRVTLTDHDSALLHIALHGCESAVGPRDQAVERAVRQIIAARLAPIRALAEGAGDLDNGILVWDLRAALEATEADLSASQDHDGAEGQSEGEKPADRRCPTCGIPFAHYTHDPQGRPL